MIRLEGVEGNSKGQGLGGLFQWGTCGRGGEATMWRPCYNLSLFAMESRLGILGSGTENIEIGVVSSSVPDEAAKCLDSFSGTVGQFERSPEFLSPLFSLCARSSARIERWSPEPQTIPYQNLPNR